MPHFTINEHPPIRLKKLNGLAARVDALEAGGGGGAAGVSTFNTRTGAVTLTSTDVTGALGFTPYSNANPSGFISGISSGDVTTALGFTPYDALEIKYAKRDFGVVGDGSTSDVAALVAMAAYAKANPDYEYRFSAGMRMALPTFGNLDFGGARVRARGARFICSMPDPGNSYVFTLGAGADWDVLNIKFIGGGFQRFAVLQGRVGDLAAARVGLIKLWSATPIGTLTDQTDGAIKFAAGDAVTEYNIQGGTDAPAGLVWCDAEIGRLETHNINFPLNTRIPGSIGFGWRIGFAKVRGYCLGLRLSTTRGWHLDGFDIQMQAVGASTTPGYNGILLAGSWDGTAGNGLVADAGEHGVRIGGGLDAVQIDNRNNSFGEIIVKRPGQCGFKAWADYGSYVDGLTIASLTVIDCAFNNTTGPNEDGLRLEQCRNVSIGPVVIKRHDKARSCYDGLYITGGQNIRIPNIMVDGATRDAIRVERLNGGQAPGNNITPTPQRDIYIGLTAVDCLGNAAYVDTQTLLTIPTAIDPGGETNAENIRIDVSASGTKGVFWRSGTVPGCAVHGTFRNIISGALLDLNSLPVDVDLLDVANAKRIIGAPGIAVEALGALSASNLSSGTYTPSLVNATNIAASTAGLFRWTRIGNIVTVSGRLTIDPTASGAIALRMTLPIASNIGAAGDLAGVANTESGAFPAEIYGSASTDTAVLSSSTTVTTNAGWSVVFNYLII